MGIYTQYILPRVLHLAMQNPRLTAERATLVPRASGKVLEVGIGSGLNVPFYSRHVEILYGLDPSHTLWDMARPRLTHAPFPIEHLALSGEHIPIADRTLDTVVTTWTLCTIPDPARALREMRRVLKPEGQLIFIEHGQAPERTVRAWQDRLNPLWQRIAGGCHLNRPIDALILAAGFRFTQLATAYCGRPRPFTFFYKGLAQPT